MAIQLLERETAKLKEVYFEETQESNNAEELFHRLKSTSLYAANVTPIKGLDFPWYDQISVDNKTTPISSVLTVDQLMGMLVLSLFDKEEAKRQFDKFKATEIYNKEENLWYEGYLSGQGIQKDYDSAANLVSILLESQFDVLEATRRFGDLQKTPLHDKSKNRWNAYMSVGKYALEDEYAHIQLLAVLCWARLGCARAKDDYRFNSLRKPAKADGDGFIWWHTKLATDIQTDDSSFRSQSQLLDTLIQLEFKNFELARKNYERLKRSELYNKDLELWKTYIQPNFPTYQDADYIPSFANLLGVWVEYELSKAVEKNKISTTQPEEREF